MKIKEYIEKLENKSIPRHVAIIMDGNGRWAEQRKKPRSFGHHEGMKRVVDIVQFASDLGIEYLSLYAFSTENWLRPKAEVDYLMKLLSIFIRQQLERLHNNNVVIRILGDIYRLPEEQLRLVKGATDLTKSNTGMTLNIALNYGARDEIIRATKKLCRDVLDGSLSVESIDEQVFNQYLDTEGEPDIDLLIRPGGEERLSNFLLYQNAYSELVFLPILWPDFHEEDLFECIMDFSQRNRRFGGSNE